MKLQPHLALLLMLGPSVLAPSSDTHAGDRRCIDPYGSSHVLAVLFERSFLNSGHESELPRFVLYEDGRVIYATCREMEGCEYFQVRLDGEQLAYWKGKLSPSPEFLALRERYELVTHITDLPEVQILLSDPEGRLRHVSVYGLEYPGSTVAAYAITGKPEYPDKVPIEFARYHDLFHNFKPHPNAKPWSADWFEVQLSPLDYYFVPDSQKQVPAWEYPDEWPRPCAPGTMAVDDQTIRFFLPITEQSRFSKYADLSSDDRVFGVTLQGVRYMMIDGPPIMPGVCEWENALGY